MSGIKLDVTITGDVNSQIGRAARRIADVRSDTASTSVDGAVAARRSIGSRLGSTAQRLGRVETSLQMLHTCIEDALERYRQAEKEVVRESERLKAVRSSDESNGGWWSAAKTAWDRNVHALEKKAAGIWEEVDNVIEQGQQAITNVEAKVVGWIEEGERFADEWIEEMAYEGQYKEIVEKWIDGTVLDNKFVHELIDEVDHGAQLFTHFEAGVARGLVDTAAGIVELGVIGAAETIKHNPAIEAIKTVEYGVDVAYSGNPLEKLKSDAKHAAEQAAIDAKNVVVGVKNAAVDMAHEFSSGDANHKADMLGFGVEKIAELFVPVGLAAKGAVTAEEAASTAAKLRSTVVANVDQSKVSQRLNTYGDALRNKLGSASNSHAEEYNQILRHAEDAGVQVDFREGALAYEPSFGNPGRLILDPEASIGAVRHEYRHMLDDFELGHPGMRIIADSDLFWRLEFRGYMEEVKLAREIRDFDAGRFIMQEMRARRKEILGR